MNKVEFQVVQQLVEARIKEATSFLDAVHEKEIAELKQKHREELEGVDYWQRYYNLSKKLEDKEFLKKQLAALEREEEEACDDK